jgi:hypothetical protein
MDYDEIAAASGLVCGLVEPGIGPGKSVQIVPQQQPHPGSIQVPRLPRHACRSHAGVLAASRQEEPRAAADLVTVTRRTATWQGRLRGPGQRRTSHVLRVVRAMRSWRAEVPGDDRGEFVRVAEGG